MTSIIPVPITKEDLSVVFSDAETMERIIEIQTNWGQESAFGVPYNVERAEFLVSKVVEGDKDKVRKFNLYNGISKRFQGVPLLTYHSHDDQDIIVPSGFGEGEDLRYYHELRALEREYGLDMRTLHAITIHEPSVRAPWSIMVLQECLEEQLPLEEAQRRVDDLLTDEVIEQASQEDIMQRLRQTGLYRCELMQVLFHPQRGRYFPAHELEKLAAFSFTPRILDYDKFRGSFEKENSLQIHNTS